MIKSMNVAWWVQKWATLQPEKTALHFEGRTVSYGELHVRANGTSCWLQSVGIGKGDRVAVLLDNSLEFVEVYLACARVGAVFVPLNFRLAAAELGYILGHARPRLLVAGREFAPAVPAPVATPSGTAPLTAWVGGGDGPEASGALDYTDAVAGFAGRSPFRTPSLGASHPEEPHVIMYTSGTTGHPKGAVLSHHKTFFNCLNADIFLNLSHDDVVLVVLPLFHSGGLFILATPALYKGAAIVLQRRFDPAAAYANIARYRVTKFLAVPTVYRALFRVAPEERGDTSSLEVCAIGGEKVTPEMIEECHRNGFTVRQIMGQTETSILLWASEEDALERRGTVGRPVFHAEVRLVGEDGREVRPGEVGEIVVSGPTLMKEYWRDPVETEAALRGGWLHTGDLARMDGDGYFFLVDRARDMYISGGENVYPAELELVLKTMPGVVDAAVVGVPDAEWGEVGRAFIVCGEGEGLTQEDVLAYCESRLARYKVPKDVVFRRELPRTAVGKVRKFLLMEPSAGCE